jgi:hypothetical protein
MPFELSAFVFIFRLQQKLVEERLVLCAHSTANEKIPLKLLWVQKREKLKNK